MPDIEWRLTDQVETETVAQTVRRKPPRGQIGAVLLVILIGIGLGLAYRSIPEPAPRPTSTSLPPTATPRAIPAKLYETINREAQALADGDLQAYLKLHVPEGDYWTQLISNTFQAWEYPTDGQAFYSIIDFNLSTPHTAWADIRQFRNGHSFRETRFYMWGNDRWLRDDPDPSFWSGKVETLDTPHLHVIYAIEDRELAHIVADQLEELHASICAELSCATASSLLTYTVNLNDRPLGGDNFHLGEQTLSFPSPRVMGIYEDSHPYYVGNAEVNDFSFTMSWAIAQRLAYGQANAVATQPPGTAIMSTIANWASRRVSHQDAAQKLRADSLKSNLQPLLTRDDIWAPPTEDNWQKAYTEDLILIYFIEQQYGAAAVPNVLKNLGQAQSFADLIDKSLGVPFIEFDQQWQAWLKP